MASALSIPTIVMDGPADEDMQTGSDVDVGQNDGDDFDIDLDSVGDVSAQGDLDLMDADLQDSVMDEQTPLPEGPFNQAQDSWSAVEAQEPRSSEMVDDNPDEDIDAPMPEITNEEEDIDSPIPDADEADEEIDRHETAIEAPPKSETYTNEGIEDIFPHDDFTRVDDDTAAVSSTLELDASVAIQDSSEVHGETEQILNGHNGDSTTEIGNPAEGDNVEQNIDLGNPAEVKARESSNDESAANVTTHEPREEHSYDAAEAQPHINSDDGEQYQQPDHEAADAAPKDRQDPAPHIEDATMEKNTVVNGQYEEETDSLDGYLHMHPVKVLYQDSEISLFAPVGDDESQFFLQDETLAKQGVDHLFAALREVLGSSIADGEQLTLHVASLDLDLCEDSKQMSQVTIEQILDLYLGLLHNDGADSPEALYLVLETRPTFQMHLNKLQHALTEGHGLSSLDLFHKDSHEKKEFEDQTLEEHNESDEEVAVKPAEETLTNDDGLEQTQNSGTDEAESSPKADAGDSQIPEHNIIDETEREPSVHEITTTNTDTEAYANIHDWDDQDHSAEPTQAQFGLDENAQHAHERNAAEPLTSTDGTLSGPAAALAEDPTNSSRYIAGEELESSLSETVQGDTDFLDEAATQTPNEATFQDQETAAIPTNLGDLDPSADANSELNDEMSHRAEATYDNDSTNLESDQNYLEAAQNIEDDTTAMPEPGENSEHISEVELQSEVPINTGSYEEEASNVVLEPLGESIDQADSVDAMGHEGTQFEEQSEVDEDGGHDGDAVDFEDAYEESEFDADDPTQEGGEVDLDASEAFDGDNDAGFEQVGADADLEATLELGDNWEEFGQEVGDETVQQDTSQKRTREEDDGELFNLASPDLKRRKS